MGKPMGSGFTSIREARVPKVFLRIEKNRFPGDSPILRSQNHLHFRKKNFRGEQRRGAQWRGQHLLECALWALWVTAVLPNILSKDPKMADNGGADREQQILSLETLLQSELLGTIAAVLSTFEQLLLLGSITRACYRNFKDSWEGIWIARVRMILSLPEGYWQRASEGMLFAMQPSNTSPQADLQRVLRAAVKQGKAEHVRVLAQAGGDELLLNRGNNILWYAIRCGHADVVHELVMVGGRNVVLHSMDCGNTHLHFALGCRPHPQISIVEELLSVGGKELALMHVRPAYGGATCLQMSAENGHLAAVEALLAVGGSELLMATDVGGRSCLFLAAKAGHLQVVQLLLDVGGHELLRMTTHKGKSAVDVSQKKGHADVTAALMQAWSVHESQAAV